jgi:hypothetical protein
MHELTKLVIRNEIIELKERRSRVERDYNGTRARLAELEERLINADREISQLELDLSGGTPSEGKPWYPGTARGFGDWIEGRVPEAILRTGVFEVLYAEERNTGKYGSLIYSPGGFSVSQPENVVAYRLKHGVQAAS